MILICKISEGNFYTKKIIGDLDSLQEEVGGLITLTPYFDELTEKGIDIYADDEGLIKRNQRINLVVLDDENNLTNVLVGNVIFTGHDDEGNLVSLSCEQVDFLQKHLARIHIRGYEFSVLTFFF